MSGDGHFLKRHIFCIAHNDHATIFFGKAVDKEQELFPVYEIKNILKINSLEFEAALDENIQRHCFFPSIFINDQAVQNMIVKCTHEVYLPGALKIFPCFSQ